MPDDILVILTTCPDAATAERLAAALVTERLAACVNQLPGVQSTYVWNGTTQRDAEILLLIKTTAAQLAPVTARIQALHPYQLPEVIAVPACGGSHAYLEWVRQNAAG